MFKVVLISALLFFVECSTDQREFVEGFLTGFQQSKVEIGTDCLNTLYIQKIETNIQSIIEAFYNRNYFKAGLALKSIFSEAEHELESCHYKEIKDIITTIGSVGHSALIFRMYTNAI